MRARTRLAMTVAVVAVLAASWAGVAGAASPEQAVKRDPRTITVVGTGMVSGTPDVLDLTIGVETHGKSAGEALDRNSTLVRRVIEVLRAAGVPEKDIQTSNLSMSPFYRDNGREVDGYTVSNLVTATIRNLGKAGGVVDAATKVAGNEVVVHGVYFSFDDNAPLVAQARAEAVKRARGQAEQLARAAGVQLGDLLSVSEDSAPDGPVIPTTALPKAASGDTSTPVQPGSQSLSVQVTMVYEIR